MSEEGVPEKGLSWVVCVCVCVCVEVGFEDGAGLEKCGAGRGLGCNHHRVLRQHRIVRRVKLFIDARGRRRKCRGTRGLTVRLCKGQEAEAAISEGGERGKLRGEDAVERMPGHYEHD